MPPIRHRIIPSPRPSPAMTNWILISFLARARGRHIINSYAETNLG
ncbi:hypothetical protein SAMN02746093_02962 [Legionella quinlivanii DSM 21216]|nr:hypothetical protein SAMN02746093_02962 [Legionella quinlivanii DSM 21216]STY09750.1 Uncharacterised protein [Legionella quinlivanii]